MNTTMMISCQILPPEGQTNSHGASSKLLVRNNMKIQKDIECTRYHHNDETNILLFLITMLTFCQILPPEGQTNSHGTSSKLLVRNNMKIQKDIECTRYHHNDETNILLFLITMLTFCQILPPEGQTNCHGAKF